MIKYITFDQLMASVESDLGKLADQGMINRGTCIKVVQKVNAELGLKIHQQREKMLQIENYKADLPEDFLYLQMAVACAVETFHLPGSVFGTHTEERETTARMHDACLNEQGGCFWVAQQYKEKTVKFERLIPLRLTNKSLKHCADKCVNTQWSTSAYDVDIDNGELVTNFPSGKIYINYLSDLVDDKGNLLVLDHPLVTEYYEYAIKKHLMENFMLNGDLNVERRWGHMKGELRDARIRAISFINTPEYTEIQQHFTANRLRFWNKYHSMFYA